ncbi:MAG: trans-2-enoyl-CoA reductase family protein [Treponema sp.]|nr:trans-2-enoyl-CoA reductase family protein [Treponema sp.]
MSIKPMIRSNICINAHPEGCAKETDHQIDYAKSQKSKRGIKSVKEGGKGPKFVLVLGCSTGYGLASRIVSAFEYGADTMGVSFEKEGTETKCGTPGFYNNKEFDKTATEAGLYSKTFNADAFSHETRAMIIDEIKKTGKKIDLLVYSLASPVRKDPDSETVWKSVIKPIGQSYSGNALNILQECLMEGKAEPATEQEIEDTVKVMGGADWKLWINALLEAGVLDTGCRTVAYSYIGPVQSHAIYRSGTIGMAKKDLEATARDLSKQLKTAIGGDAWVSVNKGLVTRSSAVIPVISLYLSVLFKIMKDKGIHEGCIEQMDRLFAERLFTGADNAAGNVPVDSENLIRIDDWEMREDVQSVATEYMAKICDENLKEYCDLEGYKHDFLATNGFDVAGVNYDD